MTESREIRAWKIADAAATAWWAARGGNSIEIPLGVIAALSLTAAAAPSPPDLAERISALSQEDFTAFLSRIWRLFAITRPELSIRTGPLARWLDEDGDMSRRAAAFAAARAIIAADELFAFGEDAPFKDADLLGCAYQALANPRGTKARGEVYTSPDVAELLMRIKLAGAHPGQSILDEGAGTGSLLRAAAHVLRDMDVDPRTMHWYASDIDPIAIAALAVNVCLWDLGPHVIVGRANIITDPDWPSRAREEQIQAIQNHDLRLTLARLLTAEHVLTRQPPLQPGPGTRL